MNRFFFGMLLGTGLFWGATCIAQWFTGVDASYAGLMTMMAFLWYRVEEHITKTEKTRA